MKKLLLLLTLSVLLVTPVQAAEPGQSCGAGPEGNQPGILDYDRTTCLLVSNDCDPSTQSCAISGCNPATQSCKQEPRPGPEGNGNSGFVPLVPGGIPGLTTPEATSVVNSDTLANFFNNLYKYVIGLAAALAIIQLIRGGLTMAFTGDNVSKLIESKGIVRQAIFGLVLVFLPVIVFSVINPSILNLSLNLPALNTTSSIPSGNNGGGGGQEDPATGCTVTGTKGVLEIATCPSGAAAQEWGQGCTGRLSEVVQLTTQAGGGVGKSRILCGTNKRYMFIRTVSAVSFTYAINTIRPLARTEENQNNASEAILFSNICRGANRNTCISDNPSFSFATDCPPGITTDIPGDDVGLGKCYDVALFCEDRPDNTRCDDPSWTPFQ